MGFNDRGHFSTKENHRATIRQVLLSSQFLPLFPSTLHVGKQVKKRKKKEKGFSSVSFAFLFRLWTVLLHYAYKKPPLSNPSFLQARDQNSRNIADIVFLRRTEERERKREEEDVYQMHPRNKGINSFVEFRGGWTRRDSKQKRGGNTAKGKWMDPPSCTKVQLKPVKTGKEEEEAGNLPGSN